VTASAPPERPVNAASEWQRSKSRLNIGSGCGLEHAIRLSNEFCRFYRTRAQFDAQRRGNL
jgi:hypothetical protein